jgi:hypothetical protein
MWRNYLTIAKMWFAQHRCVCVCVCVCVDMIVSVFVSLLVRQFMFVMALYKLTDEHFMK